LYTCVFIQRLGRRKHARKQTTRKIEKKRRKNTFLLFVGCVFYRFGIRLVMKSCCVCARELDYLSDANTSTYAVPDRFMASTSYPLATVPPFQRSQHDGGSPAAGYGGPVDDSGVYSALPGTPPPWASAAADYDDDDDRGGTTTDRGTSVTLPEFPRERLRFVEKLGQGLFGEVRIDSGVNQERHCLVHFLRV